MTASDFRDVVDALRLSVTTLGHCFDRLVRFHFHDRGSYDLIQDENG